MIIETYNPCINKFLKHVQKECRENKIKLLFSTKSYVKYSEDFKSNGYFDAEDNILAVSLNHSEREWLTILVHEFCHMKQWIEYSKKEWEDYTKHCDWLFEWLETKSARTPNVSIAKTRDLELDCEKRASEMIEKFNLPLDKSHYIRKANCYVHFYNYIAKVGKWYKIGKEPYRNKNLISLMPDNFDMNYSKLPKGSIKYFKECV